MERDFLGLSMKQATSEDTADTAPVRSSAMQWPFSNKGSSLLSFHGVQEEKPTMTGFDSLASTRSVTSLKTTEAFDYSRKNIVSENQGGVRYTTTTYPTNHLNTYAFHRPFTKETDLTISPAGTTSIHQSVISTSRQNRIGSVSSPPLSIVPMTNPVPSIPSNSPIVGTTDLRNASNVPGAPDQLTIFYNGSVCVFDNVAPEKAQAIMLLCGNGHPMTFNATPPPALLCGNVHPMTSNTTPPSALLCGNLRPMSSNTTPPPPLLCGNARPMSSNATPPPPILCGNVRPMTSNATQPSALLCGNGRPMTSNATPPPSPVPVPVQASIPRSNVLDGFVMSRSYSTSPHCSSPVPVNSISASHQPVGRSNANNDTDIAKPPVVLLSSSNNAKPMRVVNSLASVATTPLPSDTVPQFRKKSLARFLEKRKERVISANPYADKQSKDFNNPASANPFMDKQSQDYNNRASANTYADKQSQDCNNLASPYN